MRKSRKKKEAARRKTVRADRVEGGIDAAMRSAKQADKAATELRAQEAAIARSRPLSVASNIIMREGREKASPSCSIGDIMAQKYGSNNLPRSEHLKTAVKRKAPPNGRELAFPGSVMD